MGIFALSFCLNILRPHVQKTKVECSDAGQAVKWALSIVCAVLVCTAFAACDAQGGGESISAIGTNEPANAVLLFSGTGTSPNDVAAVEGILKRKRQKYTTASSSQLNSMDEAQLNQYRLLIVPGGNFIHIGNSLSSSTATNIRNAVQHGLNYLGICAGAFIAGNSVSNGLNLTSGVKFGFYSAEARGIRKAAVPIAIVGGPTLEHYWEDGPQLTGWGLVVGKYPDGTPAIVQGKYGIGAVILSGVHPEAPAGWRRGMSFTTPAKDDNDYAWTLIQAALNQESLPHY